jgi:hypothetical protein
MVDNLINLQRPNCQVDKLLSEKDLKRIFNRTGGITNTTNECILWKGYITHNKIDYINFYFKGKKCALHRILYINFKGKLNDNDYLEFICDDKLNKGKCCNINHIVKKRCVKKFNINNNLQINSPNNSQINSQINSPNNSQINSPNINIVYFD